MGVRGTDRGGGPIAKSVEFSMVPGREGHHLLGQSLRSAFHFLLLFKEFYPLRDPRHDPKAKQREGTTHLARYHVPL